MYERLIAAGTYFSVGGVGLLWFIIALLKNLPKSSFMLYHFFQSIFIGLCFFVLSFLANMIYVILYRIPLINAIPYYLNMPLLYHLSLIQIITSGIILYLAVTAFLGYFSYLPWVSDIIKGNFEQK